MPKTNNSIKSKSETYLSADDHDRFISVCRQRKASRAEIAREAIRWYLEYRAQGKESKIESEVIEKHQEHDGSNMRHARTPGRADRDTVRASMAEPCRKQNARSIHRSRQSRQRQNAQAPGGR